MHTEIYVDQQRSRVRVFTLLVLCSLPFLLLGCAPSTGVFSGGQWQPTSLGRQHIRALAVNSANTQALYAGDAQGNIFASTDAGQHWVEHSSGLPLPLAIQMLAFDNAGKKLYAATDKGFYVSSDAALHWNSLVGAGSGLPAGSYTAVDFDLNAPKVIFVAAAHQGVFVSNDEGTSWTAIHNGLPQDAIINTLVYDSDHRQLWLASTMGIYRSDDKGASWHALNTGLPDGTSVYAIQPASISGGIQGLIYAGTNHGLFLSHNTGTSWEPSRTSFSATSIRCVLIDFRSANATTVYMCTDAGAFRSDDSGQTWRNIATGLPHGEPVYAMAIGAEGYAQLFVATNNVYQFPGNSGGIDPGRILSILLVLAFFYVLYRLTRRSSKHRREMLKPERIIEPSSSTPSTPESS